MKKKKEPIRIKSDRMEAYSKKNLIIFIGTVIAVQGQMEIRSERLEVHIKKQKEKIGSENPSSLVSENNSPSNSTASPSGRGQQEISRLIATGNVRISQGNGKHAAAERLDYNKVAGHAILTGNPRAWEKNNQLIGTKIEFFLREDRTVVHGNRKRRVSVTLFPDSRSKAPINGINAQ